MTDSYTDGAGGGVAELLRDHYREIDRSQAVLTGAEVRAHRRVTDFDHRDRALRKRWIVLAVAAIMLAVAIPWALSLRDGEDGPDVITDPDPSPTTTNGPSTTSTSTTTSPPADRDPAPIDIEGAAVIDVLIGAEGGSSLTESLRLERVWPRPSLPGEAIGPDSHDVDPDRLRLSDRIDGIDATFLTGGTQDDELGPVDVRLDRFSTVEAATRWFDAQVAQIRDGRDDFEVITTELVRLAEASGVSGTVTGRGTSSVAELVWRTGTS